MCNKRIYKCKCERGKRSTRSWSGVSSNNMWACQELALPDAFGAAASWPSSTHREQLAKGSKSGWSSIRRAGQSWIPLTSCLSPEPRPPDWSVSRQSPCDHVLTTRHERYLNIGHLRNCLRRCLLLVLPLAAVLLGNVLHLARIRCRQRSPTNSLEASSVTMVVDRVVGDDISDDGGGRGAREELGGCMEAGNGGRRREDLGRSGALVIFERIWDRSGLPEMTWRARQRIPISAPNMGPLWRVSVSPGVWVGFVRAIWVAILRQDSDRTANPGI